MKLSNTIYINVVDKPSISTIDGLRNYIENYILFQPSSNHLEFQLENIINEYLNNLYYSGDYIVDNCNDPIIDRNDIDIIVNRTEDYMSVSCLRKSKTRREREIENILIK